MNMYFATTWPPARSLLEISLRCRLPPYYMMAPRPNPAQANENENLHGNLEGSFNNGWPQRFNLLLTKTPS